MALQTEPTEYLINQVWLGMLDSDRLSRYYSRITYRYQQIGRWFIIAVTLLSSGVVVLFLTDGPVIASQISALVVAVLSIWLRYADYSTKAYKTSQIANECANLSLGWKSLWSDLYTTPDIDARVSQLNRELVEITKDADLLGVTGKKRLHEKCARETYESAKAEFAE